MTPRIARHLAHRPRRRGRPGAAGLAPPPAAGDEPGGGAGAGDPGAVAGAPGLAGGPGARRRAGRAGGGGAPAREAEERRRREWAAKPPEERIAGRLQFWVLGRRAKRHEPTAAEIAARAGGAAGRAAPPPAAYPEGKERDVRWRPPQAPPTATRGRRRRRFTVDEYHRMAEAGILARGRAGGAARRGRGRDEPRRPPPRHRRRPRRATSSPAALGAGGRRSATPEPVDLGEHDEPRAGPGRWCAPGPTLRRGPPHRGRRAAGWWRWRTARWPDDQWTQAAALRGGGRPGGVAAEPAGAGAGGVPGARPARLRGPAAHQRGARVAPLAFPELVLAVADLLPAGGPERARAPEADPQRERERRRGPERER